MKRRPELLRRMLRVLAAGVLASGGIGANAADAVTTPGAIEGVGLYGTPAIVVHRTLTTKAHETCGGWH